MRTEPDSIADIMTRGRAKSEMFHDWVDDEPEAKVLNGADEFLAVAGAHYGKLTGKPASEVEIAAMQQLIREGYQIEGDALTDREAERLSIAVHNRVSEVRYFGAASDGATAQEAQVRRIKSDLAEAERELDGSTSYAVGSDKISDRFAKDAAQPTPDREDAARALHRAGLL